MIGRVLQKIEEEKAQAIIIAPFWTTQPWWPTSLNLVKGPCYLLPKPHKILKLEHKPETRYHQIKTRLIVFNISRRLCDYRDYQKTLKIASLNRGEKVPGTNTTHILKMDSSLQMVDKFLYAHYTGSCRIPNGLVQTRIKLHCNKYCSVSSE